MRANALSRYLLVACFVACAVLTGVHFASQDKPLVTSWDVYGYYVYLPATFTYGDLSSFDFVEDHFQHYPISSGMYQLAVTGDRRVPIYTVGLALLWAPFYLVADISASLGPWERDGLSPPYQWALIVASFTFAILGFCFLWRVLRRYFEDHVVAVVLAAVFLGTNYFHYISYEPGMPHTYLFAGHALLLYCADSWFRDRRMKYVLSGAVCLAIMCLIRPTEVVAVLLPVVYLLHNRRDQIHKAIFRPLLVGLGVATLVILPQLLLWKANTDHWVFNAYAAAGHVFHFDGRYVIDGLLSYRKGWLVYTPVMIMALVGLGLLRNETARWKWPILAVVVAYIWITFSWHMWYYASSFGARPMIHVYPELALGLAAILAWVFSRRWTKGMGTLLLLGFVVLNLFQTWQYHQGVLPKDQTTKEIYWSIFGQTSLDRSILISIDIPNRLKGIEKYRRSLLGQFQVSSPADLADHVQFATINNKACQLLMPGQEYSESVRLDIDSAKAKRLSGAWIESTGTLYASGSDFDQDNMARMILSVDRGTENVVWQAVRFQVFMEPGQWNTVTWEYCLPEMHEGDLMKLLIWNQSRDTIGIRHLAVSVLEKRD